MDAAPAQTALVTEEDKTLYALGKLLGRNIGVFQLTPHEFEIVEAGLAEAVFKSHPERIDIDVYGPKVDELARTKSKQAAVEARRPAAMPIAPRSPRSPARKPFLGRDHEDRARRGRRVAGRDRPRDGQL